MDKDLEKHILALENRLLQFEVRKSPEEIGELLYENFTEFCSTGEIYNYSAGDTFYEDGISFEIIDFDLMQLADNCVLAKYTVKKRYIENRETKQSIRSSVWKCFDEKWKMVFHQGTLVKS